MEAGSFSARRAAASGLPAFALPPPNSETPRAGDGLSPGASVNTASSQGSQQHSGNLYTYHNSVQAGWETPASHNYNVSPPSHPQSAQHPPGQSSYGHRSSIFAPHSTMGFASQRNSQSPATGAEGLAASTYDSVHQSYNASLSNGGAGTGSGGGLAGHHSLSPIQSAPHNAFSAHHNSTQPPTPGAPAPVDSYAHPRTSNAAYYVTSTSTQPPTFPSYAPPHPTHSQPSPTSSAPRGIGSLSGPSMAPPHYRTFNTFSHMPHAMNGPVMSNIHQPGSQMSVIPGMAMSHGYGAHHLMYGHPHAQAQPQTERPFKCDQCTQSFSRNHDLKRHKRIHLAVKPFPCDFCAKAFSRKDALKRHRLVRGCEAKALEAKAEELARGRTVDVAIRRKNSRTLDKPERRPRDRYLPYQQEF